MALDKTRFTLRLNEEIQNKIRAMADKNKRSVNSEIEFILEQAILIYEKEHGPLPIPEE